MQSYKLIRLVFMVGLLGMFPIKAISCETCAKELSLFKQQVACLEQRLPEYLNAAADPVIVSLLSCDKPEQRFAPSASVGMAAQTINPIIDDKGDRDAASKILFLTKQQLSCLRDLLPRLKSSKERKVVIRFDNCK